MNQKRYWLRGGITGLIFGILVICILVFLAHNFNFLANVLHIDMHPVVGNESTILLLYRLFGAFIYALYKIPLIILSPVLGLGIPDLFLYSFSTIIYGIIGMLLGWIYGKIKNRNIN